METRSMPSSGRDLRSSMVRLARPRLPGMNPPVANPTAAAITRAAAVMIAVIVTTRAIDFFPPLLADLLSPLLADFSSDMENPPYFLRATTRALNRT